jgi:hypothetical protein
LERLDRKFGLVLWLLALERRKTWHDLAVRIGQERRDLREKLNPRLKAQREFQERVKRLGWDQVLTEWMETEEGKHVVGKWGIDRAGSGSPADAGDLREDSVHREPPQLPDGGLQWREGHRGHMGAGD